MHPSFFKNLGPIQISKIKKTLDCETLNIAHDEMFNDFLGIKKISNKSISFLNDNELLKKNIPNDSAIICTRKKFESLNNKKLKVIIVRNVQEAVAIISNIFYRDLNEAEILEFKKPVIGNNCAINKNSILENGTLIGNNVSIGYGVFIGHNCSIGDNSKIDSNSIITNSIIGANVVIGRNSSIGQNGFGFYMQNDENINIYHSGRVILQSNVSIGAGCTIDRGSFDDTIIGENTYFDNLCHIAHNVQIGRNSAFAAMTGIAGSSKIGNNVLVGGQAGIAGHITIGNNVQIAAKSGVFDNLPDGASVMGNPAVKKFTFIKNYKKTYVSK